MAEGFVAVDWGTSNRRAYAVAGGTVVETFEDGLGILEVAAGGFAAEVAGLRARFGGRPMLLAGMVGSNRGWVEAPYVAAPAGLAEVAAAIRWVEPGVGIVPGVMLAGARADVMRGEETQALGAVAAGLVPADAVLCHPGTHAKWIRLAEGRIADFRTVMTGEVFALMKGGGILAPQLVGEVKAGAAFLDGVARTLGGEPVLGALFGVRARALMGTLAAGDGASYASGLLIGADVGAGLAMADGRPLALVGRPELVALYAAALGVAGRSAVAIDGAAAFVGGMTALMERA